MPDETMGPTDNDIEVKIGAQTADLKAGMEQGAASVQEHTAQIKEAVNGMSSSVGGAMSNMMAGIRESFTMTSQNLENLNVKLRESGKVFTQFGELLLVGLGLERLAESVMKVVELGDSFEKTSQKVGLTVEELGRLKYAADLADVGFDQMKTGLERMALNVQMAQTGTGNAAKAFDALGVSITDAQGKTRPVIDVLGDIADKFQGSANDANKTAIAMAIFGRAGAELIPLLNKGRDGLKDMGDEAQRLGIVMDTQTAQQSEKLNDSLKTMKAATAGAWQGFVTQLLPVLSGAADSMAEGAKKGGLLKDALDVLAGTVKTIASAFDIFSGILAAAWVKASQFFNDVATLAMAAGKILKAEFTGQWKDLPGIVAEANAKLVTSQQQTGDLLAGIAKETKDKIASIWAAPDAGTAKTEDTKKDSLPGFGGGKDKSRLEDWKAELDQMKDAEGVFHEFSKQQEVAFWQSKLSLAKTGSKEYNAVFHELAQAKRSEAQEELSIALVNMQAEIDAAKKHKDEQVQIATARAELMKAVYGEDSKQYAAAIREKEKLEQAWVDEQVKMQADALKRKADAQTADLKLQEQQISAKQKLGDITAQQELAQIKALKEQEYQIELQALESIAELRKQDLAEYQKVLEEMRKLKDKHALEVQKIDTDIALASQNQWQQILNPIASAFDTSIKGMIQGTTTFQKALANIWTSILGEFVNLGVKMATHWAAQELAKTTATTVGAATRTAAEEMASAKSIAIWAATAIKNIIASAWDAAAKVYASIAAIPYIGPFLAPAMALAAGAEVVSFAGKIASAEGGFGQVPSNMMVQLHKDEMVLPKDIADPLRQQVGGGATGGAMSLFISSPDAKGVERLFRQNGAQLGKALREQVRNFNPSMMPARR